MTPAPLIVNPITGSYLSRTPYLSIAEYKNAPTATDVSQLVPNTTDQANEIELANVIRRASALVDGVCHQILAATSDIEQKRLRLRRNGTITFVPKYKPILELSTLLLGPSPSSMTALDVTDAADGWIEGQLVEVPVFNLSPALGTLGLSLPYRIGGHMFARWTYVNGWPTTQVTAGANAGDTTLAVVSSLGIYPGTTLSVYDAVATEMVTVAPSFTAGSLTLPLTEPLLYAHPLPNYPQSTSVSALPSDAKQAVVSMTSFVVKTRGSAAIVMPQLSTGGFTNQPTHMSPIEGGGDKDYNTAVDALWAGGFVRVHGR